MKGLFSPGWRRVLLAILVLRIVQSSCGGSVPPNDPRVPVITHDMVIVFKEILTGVNAIPFDLTQAPLITKLSADSVAGLGAIGAKPAEIHLFHMDPQGCNKEPERGPQVIAGAVDLTGVWSVPYAAKPGEMLAATQVAAGKESGLSNFVVNLNSDQALVVSNANELQQANHETTSRVTIQGTSFKGACVVVRNEDPEVGRVGSVSVPEGGKWQVSVQIQDGQNKFKVYVDGAEESGQSFTITGFTPKMQWPYSAKDKDGNYSSQVTAFFGYNDYYYYSLGKTFHDGIDISGEPAPSFVRAVADGKAFFVQISTSSTRNGGKVVIIDHGAWYTVYMHLSKVTVECDQATLSKDTLDKCNDPSVEKDISKFYDQPIDVKAGDIIGVTGNTGCPDCGVHLHLSAYRWLKADRETSLGKTRVLAWPWTGNYGSRLNINPPSNTTLQIGAYTDASTKKTYEAHTENSSDRLGYCASGSNAWDVNWWSITIKEFGPPDKTDDGVGTQFNKMGADPQCAVQHDLTQPSSKPK